MLITIVLLMALHDDVLLKARYIPVAGTDIEYGQGAIERNELSHHPMNDREWLFLVDLPGDPPTWQAKLNATVDPKHGSFVVECPSAEEEEQVRSGRITMQR
jgi:hypothetical protein